MENTSGRHPTHTLYHVRDMLNKDGSEMGKGKWTKVGAMWEHKDGQGFDVVFEIRVAEERLVARAVDRQSEQGA